MRYLITGGAGFIGSHLVAELCAEAAEVRVLDDFSSGKKSNLEEAKGRGGGRLEVIEGDLRDAKILESAVRGVEVIFHEAAFVSVPASMEDPRGCYEVNCDGTVSLLEAARAAGVRRVVLASSAAVYGDSDQLPLMESATPRPLSPYAASKVVDEIYAALYSTGSRPRSLRAAVFQCLRTTPTARHPVCGGRADIHSAVAGRQGPDDLWRRLADEGSGLRG